MKIKNWLKILSWVKLGQKNHATLANNNLTAAQKEAETDAQYTVMQEQIQQLTTKMNNPKSDEQINHKNNTQINYENKTQNIPSPPTLFSPRKCEILKYTHTTQLSKRLQAVFAEKRGLAKLELHEVIQLIQSIMQTITIFEKRFTTQCFQLLTENIYVQ